MVEESIDAYISALQKVHKNFQPNLEVDKATFFSMRDSMAR